jgi:hypothetical protein
MSMSTITAESQHKTIHASARSESEFCLLLLDLGMRGTDDDLDHAIERITTLKVEAAVDRQLLDALLQLAGYVLRSRVERELSSLH